VLLRNFRGKLLPEKNSSDIRAVVLSHLVCLQKSTAIIFQKTEKTIFTRTRIQDTLFVVALVISPIQTMLGLTMFLFHI
jgi:hypothetical protein